jgi:predicted N-formylglutamate amidohydrolase
MPDNPPILAADEPAPYELVNGSGRPLIFVCDHAANRVPESLNGLGVAEHHIHDHIGYDIGAAAVARRLIDWFSASGVLAVYSRLVVDLNRALHDASAFPRISDGVLIPANLGLSLEQKGERARALFHPYHHAVRNLIDALSTEDVKPVFIGVHSFTPRLFGIERPLHIGILWDKDPRLPVPLLARLRADEHIVVADNEPYSGRHPADFTIDHHAEPLGLAHTGIEIRQDLVRDEVGQERMACHVAEALEAVLDREELYAPAAAAGSGGNR